MLILTVGLANSGQPENKPVLALCSRMRPGIRRGGKLGHPPHWRQWEWALPACSSCGKGSTERDRLCPGPGQRARPTPVMVEGELSFEGYEVTGCWRLGITSACKCRLFCWTAAPRWQIKGLIQNCGQTQDCVRRLFVPPFKCWGFVWARIVPRAWGWVTGIGHHGECSRGCLIHLTETTWTSGLNYREQQQTRVSPSASPR